MGIEPQDQEFADQIIAVVRSAIEAAGLKLDNVTPMVGNPKLQGWMCGFVDGMIRSSGANDDQARMRRTLIYVHTFEGTPMSQQLGIESMVEADRYRSGPVPNDYVARFREGMTRGEGDAASYRPGTPILTVRELTA